MTIDLALPGVPGEAWAVPDGPPGRHLVHVEVPARARRRGAGAVLYDALLAALAPLHPEELHAELWAHEPDALRFAAARGFEERWRRVHAVLDPRAVPAAPADPASALPPGLRLATLADLAAEPGGEERFRRLCADVWRDVPYPEPLGELTRAAYAREVRGRPGFREDACLVALDGDEPVGLNVLRPEGDRLVTDLTGVRRAYRGRGIATALKLWGVAYARDGGYRAVLVVNDAANGAMRALNAKLGFEVVGEKVRVVRRYGG